MVHRSLLPVAAILLVYVAVLLTGISSTASAWGTLSNRATAPQRASFILVPLAHPEKTEAPKEPHLFFRLSPVQDGVLFDIDADGSLERVSWPLDATRVAFLAIDRNVNGSIDDGSEVFGAQTIPQVNWGFGALQHLEPNNGDGAIDKQDPIYAKLLLWSDRNANGRSEAEELSPLSATFARVGLGFSTLARIDDNGNRFENSGWAVFLKDFQNKADDPILATVEVFPVVTHKPGR